MKSAAKRRPPEKHAPARSESPDEILEFVFNNEEDALSSEQVALMHQRDMPALQEFLREMAEVDSRNACVGLN